MHALTLKYDAAAAEVSSACLHLAVEEVPSIRGVSLIHNKHTGRRDVWNLFLTHVKEARDIGDIVDIEIDEEKSLFCFYH